MQYNSLLETIMRHKKLFILSSILIVILLITAQYSIVSVDVTGDKASEASLELYRNGEKTASLRRGLNIASRGSYTLKAFSENELTEKYAKLGPFKMNRLKVQLAAQRSVRKVASSSLGCVAANGNLETSQEVLTYNCESVNNIARYSFVTQPTTSLAFNNILYAAKSYKSGLIGLAAGVEGTDDELRLALIQDKSVTPIEYIGSAVADATKYEVLIPTDEQGKDKDTFVVADGNEGKLTLFNNISDKQPKVMALAKVNTYSFTASGNAVYVLAANIDKTEKVSEDKIEDGAHEFGGGKLTKYTIHDNGLKQAFEIEVPKSIDLYEFEAIGEDTFAVASLSDSVDIYRIINNKLELYDRVEQAEFMVPYKQGLVYRRANDYFVYSANEKQSQLIYRLDRLSPSHIQNSNGQIVLSAWVPNTKQQYSFVVTEKARVDGLERILNYPRENISVRSIDYNDTTIFAEFVLTSFTSDRATGQFSYEPAELAEKKNTLTERLRIDGIDPSKYQIIHQ